MVVKKNHSEKAKENGLGNCICVISHGWVRYMQKVKGVKCHFELFYQTGGGTNA